MTKSLIIYYSLGGTTERIADKIAIGLDKTGYEVDKFNLKDDLVPSIESFEKYDLLGIGTPAYYFRPPFIITDYIKSLPKLDIPYFTFILYGSIIGDAGNRIRKRLNKKGGRDVGFFKCNGTEHFYGYLQRGALTYPSHPDTGDLERAEKFAISIKSNVDNESYESEDFDKKPGIVYRFERFTTQQWLVQKLYYRFFKVNKTKCTSCGICVKSCPTDAISLDKGELPKFGKECIACLNCQLKCPEEAITSIMDWWIFRPFIAYNVRNLPKIPSIELVKVKLTRGKVERLE
ncbi:MAG: EFR1 family ferrodoxin [Promethearchaeota archaeon]